MITLLQYCIVIENREYRIYEFYFYYFILFYFILFYFILFYFILFYFILFYLFIHLQKRQITDNNKYKDTTRHKSISRHVRRIYKQENILFKSKKMDSFDALLSE